MDEKMMNTEVLNEEEVQVEETLPMEVIEEVEYSDDYSNDYEVEDESKLNKYAKIGIGLGLAIGAGATVAYKRNVFGIKSKVEKFNQDRIDKKIKRLEKKGYQVTKKPEDVVIELSDDEVKVIEGSEDKKDKKSEKKEK